MSTVDNVSTFLASVINLIGILPDYKDMSTVEVRTLTNHAADFSPRPIGGLDPEPWISLVIDSLYGI